MVKFEDISNTDLANLIDEWVKGERNRRIMKRRLIDLYTLEDLAEEFSLSVPYTHKIVKDNINILKKHI